MEFYILINKWVNEGIRNSQSDVFIKAGTIMIPSRD